MRRSFGSVQQKIRQVFLERDVVTVGELLPICFPDIQHERKHLVSVRRAATRVAERLGWDKRYIRGRVQYRSPETVKADEAKRAAFFRSIEEAAP